MRKRSYRTGRGDVGIHNYAVIFDDHVVADSRVCDPTSGTQLAVFSNRGFAFDLYARIDDAIPPQLGFCAYVGVRGIDKSDAALDHQAADRTSPQQILELGEFSACIDPRNFSVITMKPDLDLLIG